MFRKLTMVLVVPLLAIGSCAHQADETVLRATATAAARSASATLQAAPDAAVDAGSARFELTLSLESPDGSLQMVSTGGYDGARMSMEMDLGSAMAGLLEGSGEAVPEGFDEPMQIVVDGSTAYLRIPMLDALTGATGWLSATQEELAAAGGSLGLGDATADPTQLLSVLRGITDHVEEVGSGEVRGVPTTRYRATVDLARAIDQAPSDEREALRSQLEELDASLQPVPVEVWIDDEGLPRRIVMDFGALASSAMGADGTATMTMELFDYGEEVDIDVPDPSETTPISEAFGAFSRRGAES